ncbi:hypothetical protein SVIO_054050 [Streptomyces violaceusniger]|uniref:AB hydrolase-1 domain-containing protein n=1 Tax=Streptomyces violaceusniger TaxID=68280 RepID=A0A4D4L148_STRVO|nr:hypothetical protein SVIO_054050 [Streptomyces violaceusniger]
MHTRLSSRPLRTLGVAFTTAALLSSGCSADASAPRAASLSKKAVPAALKPYYAQTLSWRPCGGADFECATLKAPLDYARPGTGRDLRLAVSRKKATGTGRRLGSLLVNPGGPGGSAIGYLQSFAAVGYPARVRARYDMVAMDPRGVAASEPVTCLSDKQMDAFTQTDQTPDGRGETDRLVAAYKKFARGCATRSGRILGHVSTVEAARDMDVLRAALGDRKLTYVGASYGTFLGATYADLYPTASAVSSSTARSTRRCPPGASTATRPPVSKPPSPPSPGTACAAPAAPRHRLRGHRPRPARRLLRPPRLPPGPHRRVPRPERVPRHDRRDLRHVRRDRLAPAAHRPPLRDARPRRRSAQPGRPLLRTRRRRLVRQPHVRQPRRQLPRPPTRLPHPRRGQEVRPRLPKGIPRLRQGPRLGGPELCLLACPPDRHGPRPARQGRRPIVVVGTTRDPATPYPWARALATQLSSATLLTYDGDGHTAYGRGSGCIDKAINTYLLTGRPPAPHTRCH